METWKNWKQGFDAWENATATWMEQVLQSPMLLGPAGAMLSAAAKAKAEADKQAANWWGQAGVAVKRDQERMLHEIHQLGSRLLDLEERLAAQQDALGTLARSLAERDLVLVEALRAVREATAAAQAGAPDAPLDPTPAEASAAPTSAAVASAARRTAAKTNAAKTTPGTTAARRSKKPAAEH